MIGGRNLKHLKQEGSKRVMAIKVYGADWCGDTRRALAFLDTQGVNYEYVDVEQDAQASEWVKQQNDGKERKPTIDLGGRVLCVPTTEELTTALREEGLV